MTFFLDQMMHTKVLRFKFRLIQLLFILLFFFNFSIELRAEKIGQQILDPANDVTINYIDVTELNSSIDGELLTVIFNLVGIPTQILFNRVGVPENATEYEWSVYIDIDNNQQTGNDGGGFGGIDYQLSAMHFVWPGEENNLSKPINMDVQVNTWEANDHGGFSYLEGASIVVDTQSNTLELSGTIPGISSDSNIYFHTFDYNPDGVPESDTGGEATEQEIIILSDATSDTTISEEATAIVYGSSGINQVTVASGANTTLLNFPGDNAIIIQSNSYLFSVSRSGATVTFQGEDGTVLKMPATTSAQTISFNDQTLTLNIYNGQVMLDDQVITTTAVSIDGSSEVTSECGAYSTPEN